MRKILAGTFVLTLLAVAFAGPPIDYALTCGEGGELIGVLSLTEGKVHVALVEDFVCDGVDVFVVGPEGAPAVAVEVDWDTEPPITVTIGDEPVGAVDLVVVPQVAIDGMENAQRLRAAAMEMRAQAEARREAAREGHAGDGEHGESGERGPAGPPEGMPPVEVPADPSDGEPPADAADGPPADVPPGGGPGGRP